MKEPEMEQPQEQEHQTNGMSTISEGPPDDIIPAPDADAPQISQSYQVHEKHTSNQSEVSSQISPTFPTIPHGRPESVAMLNTALLVTQLSLFQTDVTMDEDRIVSYEEPNDEGPVPLNRIKTSTLTNVVGAASDAENADGHPNVVSPTSPVENTSNTFATSNPEEVTSQPKEDLVIPRLEDILIERRGMVDDFGFYTQENLQKAQNEMRQSASKQSLAKLRKLESKWIVILENWAEYSTKNPNQIKLLCREGLPISLRAPIWMNLSGAELIRKPKLFQTLCEKPPLPIYDVIERDIDRCYPDHFFFRQKGSQGQIDLFKILKAYAHYNPAVGYCQGMGRLAGLMLMQMPAEDAFWLLVATLENYCEGYFTPSLDRFRVHAAIFESLAHKYVPAVAKHLQKNDVDPIVYMTQWFLTLYTMSLPWNTVLRVWDMFYCEGIKVLFRVGLAILQIVKDHLLKNCPSSVEIMQFLLHIPESYLDADKVMKAALRINLSRNEVAKLEDKALKMFQQSGNPDRGTVSLVQQTNRKSTPLKQRK